ncbi:hypothetical protein chiPu_0032405, partial [Chiloscyllium punctatum]|nr:hypothetical protein [Chiloscyllium punctatum]
LAFQRRLRRGRADLEFQLAVARARVTGDDDLAVSADRDVRLECLDPVLDPVAHIGEHDGAAGDADMPDRDVATIGRGRLRRRIVVTGALALQRQIDHRLLYHEVGDLGPARPQARQRHFSCDAACCEPVVGLALPRALQHDIAEGQIDRRPEANPDAAIDAELVAGLTLDPLRDGGRHEGRRNPDRGDQGDDRD